MENVITRESSYYLELNAKMQTMERELDELLSGNLSRSGKWIISKDVCKMLHICLRTLQYYKDNGLIPYSSVCGKVYYNVSDIDYVLQKNYVNSL